MTNKQPEALRLAEHLEQFRSFPDDLAAAKELRRQHARIVELEGHLAAAQRAVPEQSVPVGYVALAALTSRTHADDYAKCFATEAALIENYPAAKVIAVFDHAATQPAAQGMEQDAARYRWLRNHGFHSASAELGSDLDGAPFVCFVMRVHIPEPISLPYEEQEWTACDTDVAIDAAIAAQAKQGE